MPQAVHRRRPGHSPARAGHVPCARDQARERLDALVAEAACERARRALPWADVSHETDHHGTFGVALVLIANTKHVAAGPRSARPRAFTPRQTSARRPHANARSGTSHESRRARATA